MIIIKAAGHHLGGIFAFIRGLFLFAVLLLGFLNGFSC